MIREVTHQQTVQNGELSRALHTCGVVVVLLYANVCSRKGHVAHAGVWYDIRAVPMGYVD